MDSIELKARSDESTGSKKRKESEPPTLREYALQKFPTIYVEDQLDGRKFNFFDVRGDMVKYGYEASKEGNESTLGRLIPLGDDRFALEILEDKTACVNAVLKTIMSELKKKGVNITNIIGQPPKEVM